VKNEEWDDERMIQSHGKQRISHQDTDRQMRGVVGMTESEESKMKMMTTSTECRGKEDIQGTEHQ
jgi:hypothetical protein